MTKHRPPRWPWLAVLALGACSQPAPEWQKAGGSTDAMNIALYDCTALAEQQFPPNTRQVTSTAGYATAAGTGCGFSVSSAGTACASTGNYVPADTHAIDANQKPRDQAVTQCMMGKGWHQSAP